MSFPATTKKARLLVTLSQGLIETVAFEALDPTLNFKASDIELVQLDFDTDGAEEGDGALNVDDYGLVFVSVGEPDEMSPEDAHLARTARDTWAIS